MLRRVSTRFFICWTLLFLMLLSLTGGPVAAAGLDLPGLYDRLKGDPAYQSYRGELLEKYLKLNGTEKDFDGDIRSFLAELQEGIAAAGTEGIDSEDEVNALVMKTAMKLLLDEKYNTLAGALSSSSSIQALLQGNFPPALEPVRQQIVADLLGTGGQPATGGGGPGVPPAGTGEAIQRDAAAGVVTWQVTPEAAAGIKDGRLVLSLAGETASSRIFSLPPALLRDLEEMGATLELDYGPVCLTLPPAAYAALGSGGAELACSQASPDLARVKEVNGPGYRAAGVVYTLTAGDKAGLPSGIVARIKYEEEQGLDRDLLGVYQVQEDGTLVYCSGRIVKEGPYLEFTLPGNGSYAVMEYRAGFADLAGHWAARDVEIMAARHIAAGVGEGRFEPDRAISRAEFTSLLQRVLELPAQGTAVIFKDVPPDAWYASPVAAAVRAGLVHGFDDKTFKPNSPITRAEMAAMLQNAMTIKGLAVQQEPGAVEDVLQEYKDQADVPSWARPAMVAVVTAGIIGGRDGGLAPRERATRAEAVVMLKRLVDKAMAPGL
ncbi:S-layer homology domain-containing protein [Moorella sulfitireducens]|uniref:S-layer homology domain-containing protein n=1 Tax=Neomoorella sulfitireducens TaxID=2972948 RepID=UPI0021AD088E|nr:S-layer homology domain-containing protein [Moorella sulfitireducens]